MNLLTNLSTTRWQRRRVVVARPRLDPPPPWTRRGPPSRGLWQDHLEQRALANGAVCPDRAVVGLGDGLDDRQAEADPAGLPVSMRVDAGELVEDPVEFRGWDAAA